MSLFNRAREEIMTSISKLIGAIFIAVSLFLGSGLAQAAEYPNKTITWVAAFGAGGGTDRWARILSMVAIDVLGQATHVRNMPGASGVVAWKYVLEQPADGYTIYHASSTPVLGLLSEKDAPFSPDKLKVVAYVSQFRSILMAQPGKKWSDWNSFKSYAKANPGKISIGGTLSLLLGVAVILEQEGLKVTYVPYSSTGKAMADFVGGHISAAVGTASTALSLVPQKAVAVLNSSALPLPKKVAKSLGNPPLASALGYKGAINFPNLVGVHPDTPDEIANLLSKRIGEILAHKSVKRLVKKIGEQIIYIPREKATVEYNKMVIDMKVGLKYLQ
jgi:tripartite-type tricarboxylate transporter receptor subunit TctC